MSLTIAYLTPRYTIGRFPKEEEPVRDTRITRSMESGSDLLKSGANNMPVGVLDVPHQLRNGASFDSCCFMPAGRGTPLPPVATRAAQAIARRLAVASDEPTSETCRAPWPLRYRRPRKTRPRANHGAWRPLGVHVFDFRSSARRWRPEDKSRRASGPNSVSTRPFPPYKP